MKGVNQHPIVSSWSGRFRLSFALFEAVGNVACLQDVAMVCDAVQQGCGHLGVPKTVIHSEKDRLVVMFSEAFS